MSNVFDHLRYVESYHFTQIVTMLQTFFYEEIYHIYQDSKNRSSSLQPHKILPQFLEQLEQIQRWDLDTIQTRLRRFQNKCPHALPLLKDLMAIKMDIIAWVMCKRQPSPHHRMNLDSLLPKLPYRIMKSIANKCIANPYLFLSHGNDYQVYVKNHCETKNLIRECIVTELENNTPVPATCSWYQMPLTTMPRVMNATLPSLTPMGAQENKNEQEEEEDDDTISLSRMISDLEQQTHQQQAKKLPSLPPDSPVSSVRLLTPTPATISTVPPATPALSVVSMSSLASSIATTATQIPKGQSQM